MFSMTSTASRSCGMVVTKRQLHHTSDSFYLRYWQKMNVDFKAHTSGKMYQCPKLAHQILKVQSAMRQKGYFSFIHGAPPSSRILARLYEVMYGKQRTYYKYLRPLNAHCMGQELFMSYSYTSGRWDESAAYFGFKDGNYKYFTAVDNLKSFLKEENVKMTPEFEKKILEMFRKANQRKVGEFFILGLNEQDVNHVVDAQPAGKPTGKDVKDVSRFPEKHLDTLEKQHAHLATMRLCYDTLHPSSNIIMIDPQDPDEVDAFCKGLSFKPMKEIPEYSGLVSECDTDFEAEMMEKRAKVDEEMEPVAAQFAKMLADPNAQVTFSYDEIENDIVTVVPDL